MSGRARHILGAVIGLATVPALGYSLLTAAAGLHWIQLQLSGTPFEAVPAVVVGSVSAAAWLVGAAAVAGLMSASRRVSPLAPLIAGLPFLVLGLYSAFDYVGAQRLLNGLHPPTSPPAGADLLSSGMFLVLGGILLVSSAMPWRWVAWSAPTRWAERHTIGILIGTVGVPALWYLIQLSDPSVLYRELSVHVPYLALLPQAALVVVVGVMMSARWVSPVAAMIAGLPLLVAGLLLALGPVLTSHRIAGLLWSAPSQFANGTLVSLGAYLLIGGLLVVSALPPWRWRSPSRRPAPTSAPVLREPV